jgi:predicted O-linked N-acetylglucosamine transferase (SPINDLY family)
MRTSLELLQEADQLRRGGQPAEAEALCRKILAREPYNLIALLLLGHIAQARGDWPTSLDQFSKAARLAPRNADAQYGMASSLHALGRLEEAAQACRMTIQLQPNLANAYMNLATLLSQMGLMQQSLGMNRKAVELAPRDIYAHSNLLYARYFLADSTPKQIFDEHVRWAARHAEPLRNALPNPVKDRSPDRPLRIGYVSPDFRQHSVSFFFEPLLEHHRRPEFHITCYSAGAWVDEVTERLRSRADQWRDITMQSDEQAAALIRQDNIDILVDLSGHTGHHRLRLFALHPAPVQITYLGYPGTTGMTAMDYRITDPHADPPGMTEQYHTEQLIRLPECAWCYRPPTDSPEFSPRSSGPVTFGSFNRLPKISTAAVAVWSRILHALPDTRLLIKSEGLGEPTAKAHLLGQFSRNGIDPNRLELLGRLDSMREHLDFYNRVDIALDTFPYNGTTTTCEALWMGVPVIALAGEAHVSRVGVSLLANAGLRELVASNEDQNVKLAVDLAGDAERCAALRASIRDRLVRSPLMNPSRLATAIESAYRTAWRQWCASA